MTTPFTEFDQKVLDAVSAGNDHFIKIMAHGDIKQHAQRIAQGPGISRGGSLHGVHILERRLQALRRSGKIAFIEKAWKAVGATQ